jgi:tetraprenyl-beta-curcumene synthase
MPSSTARRVSSLVARKRLAITDRTAGAGVAAEPLPERCRARREGLAVALLFSSTALRYGTSVFPAATRELSSWSGRAEQIPDATLRRHAIAALRERGNMEGAALFGAFAPRSTRAAAVRALVAFQAAYNYLDALAEQRSDDPEANGRQLHQALLVALDPSEDARRAPHPDYYEHHPQRDDGGYLLGMVDACRSALAKLPSYALLASCAQAAATRPVGFQSLNLAVHGGFERWARLQATPDSPLEWWETAAACGSSLGVHALIGLSAEPTVDPRELTAIENVYFPWISALHSLLDSVVDIAEDSREGQRNLLSYYPSPARAAVRMGWLAARAKREARGRALTEGGQQSHRAQVVLIAIAAFYLSAPSASSPPVRAIKSSVADAVGPGMKPALLLFRVARALSRLRDARVVEG